MLGDRTWDGSGGWYWIWSPLEGGKEGTSWWKGKVIGLGQWEYGCVCVCVCMCVCVCREHGPKGEGHQEEEEGLICREDAIAPV